MNRRRWILLALVVIAAAAAALSAQRPHSNVGHLRKFAEGRAGRPEHLANQDTGSRGVWGDSAKGHGVHGQSSAGWAGYFDGRLFMAKYAEMVEIATPAAPGANPAPAPAPAPAPQPQPKPKKDA